jgi:hypothetical protein
LPEGGCNELPALLAKVVLFEDNEVETISFWPTAFLEKAVIRTCEGIARPFTNFP